MSQFYPLTLSGLYRDTADSLVLTLDVPSEHRSRFSHQAGQHLTLRTWLDDEEVRRSYSLCNGAGELPLQLAIKRVDGGRFSEWAHRHLRVGAVLEATPPAGRFALATAPEASHHYVAFAAGSGITPILSILRTTLRDEPRSHFTLVYCNRDLDSVQFREQLCELKDRHLARLSVLHHFSCEWQDGELCSGRLDRARCEALLVRCLSVATMDHAYLCGPAAMMDTVAAALQAAGLPADRVRRERFSPSAGAAGVAAARRVDPYPRAGVALTVQMDGTRRHLNLPPSEDTLLEALLKAGLRPHHSCKAGVCATCRCKVVAGTVDMETPHALDESEVAAGYVLSCRSRPRSADLELVFD